MQKIIEKGIFYLNTVCQLKSVCIKWLHPFNNNNKILLLSSYSSWRFFSGLVWDTGQHWPRHISTLDTRQGYNWPPPLSISVLKDNLTKVLSVS